MPPCLPYSAFMPPSLRTTPPRHATTLHVPLPSISSVPPSMPLQLPTVATVFQLLLLPLPLCLRRLCSLHLCLLLLLLCNNHRRLRCPGSIGALLLLILVYLFLSSPQQPPTALAYGVCFSPPPPQSLRAFLTKIGLGSGLISNFWVDLDLSRYGHGYGCLYRTGWKTKTSFQEWVSPYLSLLSHTSPSLPFFPPS